MIRLNKDDCVDTIICDSCRKVIEVQQHYYSIEKPVSGECIVVLQLCIECFSSDNSVMAQLTEAERYGLSDPQDASKCSVCGHHIDQPAQTTVIAEEMLMGEAIVVIEYRTIALWCSDCFSVL
jgi:uncharacterized protein with PIN domain